jgi:hypothetical protein
MAPQCSRIRCCEGQRIPQKCVRRCFAGHERSRAARDQNLLHRNRFGNETSVLLAIDIRFGFGRVSSTKTLLCAAMQWKRLRQAVFSPRPPSMNRKPGAAQ